MFLWEARSELPGENSALQTLLDQNEDSVGKAHISRFIQGVWIQPLMVLGRWFYLVTVELWRST